MVVFSLLPILSVLLWLCAVLPQPVAIVMTIAYLLTLGWCFLALCIKRLHDREHTRWLILLILFPVVNIFFLLYLALWRGTPAANEFGAPARSCPLFLAIVCYPIFLLTMGLNLLPDAVVMHASKEIPALEYLGLSAKLEQEENDVKQLLRCLGISGEQS